MGSVPENPMMDAVSTVEFNELWGRLAWYEKAEVYVMMSFRTKHNRAAIIAAGMIGLLILVGTVVLYPPTAIFAAFGLGYTIAKLYK